MSKYKVAHRYRSNTVSFDEGATVEVDDDQAEWVNRDSPGTLVPARAAKPEASEPTSAAAPETEPESEDEFVCETCGKVAKSAAGLAAHERSHEGED